MKNVTEFMQSMVKIDQDNSSGKFGHYPFQMFAQGKDGQLTILALALEGNVIRYYETFKKYVREEASRIYMSVDFPSGGDIKNDFVAIFTYENGKFEILAIPYQEETGVCLPTITNSEHLKKILEQFKSVVKEKKFY